MKDAKNGQTSALYVRISANTLKRFRKACSESMPMNTVVEKLIELFLDGAVKIEVQTRVDRPERLDQKR